VQWNWHKKPTDEAVIDVTPEGLLVQEIAENVSLQELQNHTEAKLIFPENTLRKF
jgi:acyl CoA:acetate/3-ketoacid CoA transferase beta subunit